MTSTLELSGIAATQEAASRQVEILGMIGTATPPRPAAGRPGRRPGLHRGASPGPTRRPASTGSSSATARAGPRASRSPPTCAAHTERLGLLVAHRPGFVAPTLASRVFATLDQFIRRPGGGAHHHRRPRRRAAARRRLPRPRRALRPHRRVPDHPPPRVDVVRALRLRGPALPLRGLRARRAAVRRPAPAAVLRRRVGGGVPGRRQARGHVHALGRAARRDRRADRVGAGRRRGRRPAGAADQRVRSARSSRRPRSSRGSGRTGSSTGSRTGRGCRSCRSASLAGRRPQNEGSRRLLRAAEKGDLHDRALWTPTATAAGAGGNTTALVGSPETVAAAILDYVEIGVDTVLIRGYDPLDDAVDYGRYVIPLVRQELASRGR